MGFKESDLWLDPDSIPSSMNAVPQTLTGFIILPCSTPVKKLKFSGPSSKVGLRACSVLALGPSPKVDLWAFKKHGPRLGPGSSLFRTSCFYIVFLSPLCIDGSEPSTSPRPMFFGRSRARSCGKAQVCARSRLVFESCIVVKFKGSTLAPWH